MPQSEPGITQQWVASPADRYLAAVAAGAGRRFRYRSRVGELLSRSAAMSSDAGAARPHPLLRPLPDLLYRAGAVWLAAEGGWSAHPGTPAPITTVAGWPQRLAGASRRGSG
jgi:hypothetical protein